MNNNDALKEGKQKEVAFWKDWFTRKGLDYQEDRRLSSVFDFMIGDKKEVKIANLGAGAMNLIGNKRRDVKVTVVASDMLADEYHKLTDELKIKLVTPVEKQDMENLTYENESFDIVYCANALDHCLNPKKALEEMVRICQPGGWIYLEHHAHEGKRLGYHGLHQWNIDMLENGDCELWNRDRQDSFLLSDIIPGFKSTIKDWGKAKIIKSSVQKPGEVIISGKKQSDLTVIYYTCNHLDESNPFFLKHIEDNLLKSIGDSPLIIVSQKPKVLGDNCTNICLGDIGRSHLNIYRQLMIGAKAAKTRYVASAEDDILYTYEHFHTERPSRDNVFLYNMNRWSIFTWTEPPLFSFRIGRKVVNALISPRDYLVEAMEERFAKFPDESKIDLSRWGDPGRYEDRLGVTVRDTEEFYSNPPIIQFNHPEGFGNISWGTNKALGVLRSYDMPYWGKAKDILKMWGDKPRQ